MWVRVGTVSLQLWARHTGQTCHSCLPQPPCLGREKGIREGHTRAGGVLWCPLPPAETPKWEFTWTKLRPDEAQAQMNVSLGWGMVLKRKEGLRGCLRKDQDSCGGPDVPLPLSLLPPPAHLTCPCHFFLGWSLFFSTDRAGAPLLGLGTA